MKTSTFAYYLLLFVFVAMMGCSNNNGPENKPIKRTYPQALNYRLVSFQKLLNGKVTPPDSVNIKAYVIGETVCPPPMECFLGNSIVLSDSVHPKGKDRLSLNVTKPGQFSKGRKYVFSIKVGGKSASDSFKSLVGYSFLKPTQ
jgi:hypothetical protein